jgi:hemolysin activation/secretion protein
MAHGCIRYLARWMVAASAGAAAWPVASQPAADDLSLVRVDTATFAEIAVTGSSVFESRELDALTDPYEDRPISYETLQALRQELSRLYVDRGYVTSGVLIPDQTASDRIVLEAVEGELTSVVVEGNRRFSDAAIERRTVHYVASPLNIADLQRGLRGLQNDPLIERINAELEPGSTLGESTLRIGVTERRPLELTVFAGNDRAASIGENHGSVGVTYRGLVGNGDALTGRFGGTDGARDNAVQYSVPLAPGGLTLDISASEQDADIVEEPFAAIDITSRIEAFNVTASRPFVDSGERQLRGFVGFEHMRSESTLLGTPFSFSAGDVDGKARGSTLGFGIEWAERRGRRTLVARVTAKVGVDALSSTEHADAPDSDFEALIGQVQYTRGIAWRDSRLLVRGLVQLTNDPLLAMYKLPVGGRYTVRGYRESQLVRDGGLATSIELQFPAAVDASGQRRGKLDVALFADYGTSVDELEPLAGSRRESLASIGAGLLWDPLPGLRLELYVGADVIDQGNSDEALQDRGLHYNLSFGRQF